MRKALLIASVLVACLLPGHAAEQALASTGGIVTISEVYGGGGNMQATYRNDYVELLNRTRQAIALTGWKVEYSSSTSTNWTAVALSGSIEPFHYYLVRMGSGGTAGIALPTPDATGSPNIARSGGKIRLTRSGTVVDLVGFGSSATQYEGARTPAPPDNVQSVTRQLGGCGDTDRNDKDFKLAKAAPKNRAAHGYYCGKPPVLTPIGAKSVIVGRTLSFTVSATDADNDPLRYGASNLPSGASFDRTNRRFTWAPRREHAGTHHVKFAVSDGFTLDTEVVPITVRTGRERSATTLTVHRQADRLAATGTVFPNHAAHEVTLRLLRYRDGAYRLVAAKQRVLNETSRYGAAFARPQAGACVITTTFPGDADHAPSSARSQFSC